MISTANIGNICLDARAKVNLALSIVGSTPNGFHKLDTIMAEVALCDKIQIYKRTDGQVNVTYTDNRSFPNDTAAKVATLIVQRYNLGGVDIVIDKKIPVGCGLGGSSADAAGVAKGLQSLFNLPRLDTQLLLSVGSDIPFMYVGGTMRAKGRGEQLCPVSIGKQLYILLYYSNVNLSTKAVFAEYDKIGGENCDIDNFLQQKESPKNALEKAAISLNNNLNNLKIMLMASGIQNVVMTGSGGGFIGYTQDEKQHAQAAQYLRSICTDKQIKMEVF